MTRGLQPRAHRQGLKSTGFVWGRRRVELGLSVRDLARLSGVNAGDLSKFENGRMIPRAEEFDRVMLVLDERALELAQARVQRAAGEGTPPPAPVALST
jgi:transcriptional regulator with XRE-family HTH domain